MTAHDATEITREAARIGGVAVTGARPRLETGAPLLFVPGLFAGAWMFERWLPHFASRGHPSFAVDLRGHGGSDPIADLGRIGLNNYVDDAVPVASALGRAVVVGHSMGALVAQRLAELDAVRAAVLISPAPPRGIPLLSLRLIARQAKYLPALLRSREIRVRRADADALILNRIPSDRRAALFSRFEADSGRAGREIMLGAIAIDARRVRCPILVLAGDADRFVPARVARRVATKYGASFRLLPGRGHLMMQEDGWAEAADEIERWLQGL